MKSFTLVIFTVACAIAATEVPQVEHEDALSEAVDKCLEDLDLDKAEELNTEDSYCLNGCLLEEFGLIDVEGKLLKDGIKNFGKNLPEKYFKEYPNLLKNLTDISPELLKANDSCDAGKIAAKSVSGLFKTSFNPTE